MPNIQIYLTGEEQDKMMEHKQEGETKVDVATRLLKDKINEEVKKNE